MAKRFLVSGADKTTGVDREVVVTADTPEQAERSAVMAGIYPSGIFVMHGDSPSSIRRAMAPIESIIPRGIRWAHVAVAVIVACAMTIGILVGRGGAKHAAITDAALEKSLPPRPTCVRGYVWVTRKDGSSSIARGVRVFLLKTTTDQTCIRNACDSGLWWLLQRGTEMLAIYKSTQYTTRSDGENLRLFNEELARQGAALGSLKMRAKLQEDIGEFYFQLKIQNLMESNPFSVVASHCEVSSVDTDVNGTYLFENVDGGPYYVYAMFSFATGSVRWMVPVQVSPGKDISIDLNDHYATYGGRHE